MQQPQYTKLTEGQRNGLLLAAAQLFSNGIEIPLAVNTAFELFNAVERRAEQWEEANYTTEVKRVKGY